MRSLLLKALFLSAAVTHLTAADPVWKSKPAAQWTEEDAKQVLTRSPWARVVTATITRRLTEDELREGGQMGQPRGVGNEGVDAKGSGPKVSPNIFTGPGGEDRSARSSPQPIKLQLRWESALPVRVAELKSGVIEPPTSSDAGDNYIIAVYGIPRANVKGDPRTLGEPLKAEAFLKREGKKDVRPSFVEAFQGDDGMVIVYVFPLSAEVSPKDGRIEFEARIGRVGIAQWFNLEEMQFQGRLEL